MCLLWHVTLWHVTCPLLVSTPFIHVTLHPCRLWRPCTEQCTLLTLEWSTPGLVPATSPTCTLSGSRTIQPSTLMVVATLGKDYKIISYIFNSYKWHLISFWRIPPSHEQLLYFTIFRNLLSASERVWTWSCTPREMLTVILGRVEHFGGLDLILTNQSTVFRWICTNESAPLWSQEADRLESQLYVQLGHSRGQKYFQVSKIFLKYFQVS